MRFCCIFFQNGSIHLKFQGILYFRITNPPKLKFFKKEQIGDFSEKNEVYHQNGLFEIRKLFYLIKYCFNHKFNGRLTRNHPEEQILSIMRDNGDLLKICFKISAETYFLAYFSHKMPSSHEILTQSCFWRSD